MMFGQEEKKKTAAEIAAEGAGRLSKFSKAAKKKDPVAAIQEYGRREVERKRKEEAEKKKKKDSTVDTAPEEGFLTRMYKKYVSGGK